MKMMFDNILVKDLTTKKKVVIADRQGAIPNKAVVVAVGPGDAYGYPSFIANTGSLACDIKVDDIIYFAKDRAMEVEIKGQKLYVVKARDVFMVLENEDLDT